MRIYLDFDGVLHPITDEYHKQMKIIYENYSERMGPNLNYFNDYPQYKKVVNQNEIFWMDHYFCWANNLKDVIERYEWFNSLAADHVQEYCRRKNIEDNSESAKDKVEIYVHSAWRGLGNEIIGSIMNEIGLGKWFVSVLDRFQYQNSSRAINILKHLSDTNYTSSWIAIDDLDDLFCGLKENHFVKCESDVGLSDQSDALKNLLKLIFSKDWTRHLK